jgi:hypothetical protein
MGAARSAPFLRINETKKTSALIAAKTHSLDLFVAMAFTFRIFFDTRIFSSKPLHPPSKIFLN